MPRRGEGQLEPRQAGASLRAEYEDRHRAWATRRRRSVWLSALWWGPAAVLLGVLAGVGTKFTLFGVLVAVLGLAAAIDVGFQRPTSLDRLKARADAESGTARVLHLLQVRGGARTLHDRFYAAGDAKFDVEHLVISPRGVFLVDSKQWHGFDVRMLGVQLFVNHVNQKDNLAAMRANADALGGALTAAAGMDEEVAVVTVTPVLSVHADDLRGTPRVMGGIIVVRPEQLPEVMRAADPRFTFEATQHIVSVAESLLPPR